MRDIGKQIKNVSQVLGKLENVDPTVQTPSDLSNPAVEENTRALSRVEDLLQTTFEQIQDLPRFVLGFLFACLLSLNEYSLNFWETEYW